MRLIGNRDFPSRTGETNWHAVVMINTVHFVHMVIIRIIYAFHQWWFRFSTIKISDSLNIKIHWVELSVHIWEFVKHAPFHTWRTDGRCVEQTNLLKYLLSFFSLTKVFYAAVMVKTLIKKKSIFILLPHTNSPLSYSFAIKLTLWVYLLTQC